ncbi:MAG: hypothetical protein K0Q74_1184 [Gammaproteobacteria bacterium]|jgi:uncharacterized protein|nr:hypothetical protein [Gammaproteobacteria bacterium]
MRAMKTHTLPKYIHPKRFCEDAVDLSGDFPISQFERLKGLLSDDEGRVVVHLAFRKNKQHIPYVEGNLQVQWHLICQRCSGKLPHATEISLLLSPIDDEKYIERLPEDYEPLIVEDDKILLSAVIEEELLLAMPLVPKHETEECMQVLRQFNDGSSTTIKKGV